MTKDLIKWLAMQEVKRSIKEWSDLKEKYIKYLKDGTEKSVNWESLIEEANIAIERNNKLLKEIQEYNF